MLRSMTTFARQESEGDAWSLTLELRSVNSRYFDAHIRIPREFMALEDRIRRILKKGLARGRVEFYLQYESHEEIPVTFIPRIELVKNYMTAVDRLAGEIGRPESMEIKDLLMILKDAVIAREGAIDIEQIWARIKTPVERLLKSAIDMASREGMITEGDIRKRLSKIEELSCKIARHAKENFNVQASALRDRISSLLGGVAIDESRITQEAAILADRLDVNEELVRLKSHLSQFYKYLEMEESAGRRLDFLVQEMFREVNTIASKSSDSTISHLVVEIKGELEKIREQLQNIV